jgi:hypothetical protein
MLVVAPVIMMVMMVVVMTIPVFAPASVPVTVAAAIHVHRVRMHGWRTAGASAPGIRRILSQRGAGDAGDRHG